ncbi:MAG: fimbrillin family protein [Bacteroidales bacterium]|nr:fimbrillin family protein [Bacteroidales bacterium]
MKRFIFSAIALVVAVTACTESGIIDAPQFYNNAIVFDTYIGKTPVTKAEDMNLAHLKQSIENGGGAHLLAFTCPDANSPLYGLPDHVKWTEGTYLNGNLVFVDASPAYWSYQVDGSEEEAYMPSGSGLAVAAYNLMADSCIDQTTQTSTDFDFTIKDVVSQQVDLLVTPLTFVSEAGETTTVPLRFYHLLSRIGFKVKSTDPSNAVIKINSIRLCGSFPKKGNVNMKLSSASTSLESGSDTPTLTLTRRPLIVPEQNGASTSEYELIEEGFSIVASDCSQAQPIYSGNNEGNRFMMIMPGEQRDGAIVVEYQLDDLPAVEAVINLSDVNRTSFEAGRAYEFILNIATKAIDFSAEVVEGGWDESAGDTDIPQEN